jgi:hypothetical protein
MRQTASDAAIYRPVTQRVISSFSSMEIESLSAPLLMYLKAYLKEPSDTAHSTFI